MKSRSQVAQAYRIFIRKVGLPTRIDNVKKECTHSMRDTSLHCSLRLCDLESRSRNRHNVDWA